MSAPSATDTAEYELVLMIDPEIPDERREQIAADARKRIDSGGNLKHDSAWGMRKMAYEIRQRTEADYRFYRFETGEGPLLDDLNHNLRIADGVLRFRIFKVDERSPVIVPPAPTAGAGPSRGPRDAPAAKVAEGTPAAEEEAPAAAAPEGAEEPAAEEPPAEEPAEQPPAEEPAAEEPAAEEPAAEEPAAEEPAAEEPPAEAETPPEQPAAEEETE